MMKVKHIAIFLGLFFASFDIYWLKTSDLEESLSNQPFEETSVPKPDWSPITFKNVRTLEWNKLYTKKRFDAFLKKLEKTFTEEEIESIANLKKVFNRYLYNEIETQIRAEDAAIEDITTCFRRAAIREQLDRAGI